MNQILCDVCNRQLDRHGRRYVMSLLKRPETWLQESDRFDLCPECAARLKVQLGRRDGQIEIRP